MNFKRIFSSFLLFALITSSISIPTPSLADTCTASARFSPNGTIRYSKDKIIDIIANVSEGCKDKKVALQIYSLNQTIPPKKEGGEQLLDTVDVPTDQGTVVSMKYKIAEKSCYYFSEDDFDEEETDDLAKNVLGLGGKDELYTLIKPLFTEGETAAKLKQHNDLYGGDWFEDYDLNALTLEQVGELLENIPGTTDAVEEGVNKGEEVDSQIVRYILSKLGVYGCNYALRLQIDDADGQSNHQTIVSDSKLQYFCSLEDYTLSLKERDFPAGLCDDTEWTSVSGFTPGIRPTLVTESLCVKQDESGSGYDEDCYETLAPIPGFGRKLNFSEDGAKGTPFTLGTYIGTVVKIAIGASSVAAVLFLTYAGVMYMIAGKSGGGALLDKARKRLFSVGWGLLVILASWIILNTINPELLKINPVIKKITLEAPTFPRNENPEFVKYQENFKIDSTPVDVSKIQNPVLIAYLYHQQGAGGGPSTLWAAVKGYSTVPTQTPFIQGTNSVNKSLPGNYPKDCKDALGPVSPRTFVECWVKKVEIFKTKTNTVPADVAKAVEQAAKDTGMDPEMLKVFCLIETSGCAGVTTTNKYGYTGLFQLSADIYKQYGIGGGDRRKEAYPNAVGGANYAKANLKKYQKDKPTIEKAGGGDSGATGGKDNTQIAGAKTLLAAGDSITFDNASYANKFKASHSDWTLTKEAANGRTTSQLLVAMKSQESQGKKYGVVSILIGTNDLGAIPIATSKSNITEIVAIAKRLAPKVVLISPPTDEFNVSPGYYNNPTNPTKQAQLQAIRSHMQTLGVPFIDFYAITHGKRDYIKKFRDTAVPPNPDNLHPTSDGHQKLKEAFEAKI